MPCKKLRRQIAFDAARLMYERQETEYFQAKIKAAGHVTGAAVKSEFRRQISMMH